MTAAKNLIVAYEHDKLLKCDEVCSICISGNTDNSCCINYCRPAHFNTQMDFVVYKDNKALILDAKWKVLDVNDEKLGISQSDLYQLFAYSEILRTKENKTVSVALLYPQTAKFYTVQEWSYFNGIKIYIVPVNVLDKNDNILLLNIIERF